MLKRIFIYCSLGILTLMESNLILNESNRSGLPACRIPSNGSYYRWYLYFL